MGELGISAVCISKTFNEKKVITNVSLSFDKGIIVFTGENGCGKSTLLKILMGLTLPDKGDVYLFGENTKLFSKKTKERINFVPTTDRTLYYKLTATENLYYIGSIYGVPKKKLQIIIPKLLEVVGLKEEGKYIETFSTGMKKRLMLAKSLINNPDILFYDEIFSGLDEEGCAMAMNLIEKLKEDGKLIILVTHQKEMIPVGSIVYNIENGNINVVDN